MATASKMGVVTVTYNSATVLPEFLSCAFKQSITDFVLFAVDNASRDDSLRILQNATDPRLRIIRNDRNLGVAEANNQGIRAALQEGCDKVLLINNDVEFNADLFQRLSSGLHEFNCEMTTAKMYYYDPPDVIWSAGGRFRPERFFITAHAGVGELDIGQYDYPRQVTYTPTCCLLVRRSVFESVGLMDSRFFVYFDDADFLYRCYKEGISLFYVPSATLHHKVSSLTGGDASDFSVQLMTRNRVYFLLKHRPIWEVCLWTTHFLFFTAPTLFLSRRDSWRTFKLRLSSVFEGWRMGWRHTGGGLQ